VAGVPSPRAGAEAPATRQSTMEAARAAEVPARATEASVRGGGWRRGGGRGGRAHDVDGDLEEEEAVLFFLEVRSNLSRGRTPSGRGSNGSFLCSLGGANRAPLASAKVLRADASIPTSRRSSRAPRAGVSTAAVTSEGSQGAVRPRGLPGSRRGRGASWKLASQPSARP
jgi:hypothetical protein